jgi:hypothetical protein
MTETLKTHRIHVVQKGDTLTGIAQEYYGSPLLWEIIKTKNEERGMSLDPLYLKIGQDLVIPGIPQLYWQRQTALIKSNRVNFQVYSPFQGSDEIFASTPYLLPPIPRGSQFTTELSLTIRDLFNESADRVQTVIENDDFRFEWKPNPARAKVTTRISAKITIKANHVWKTGRNARGEFFVNFTDLCSQIENLEQSGTLIPGGTSIATQRVAEAIPGTFEETLFFRYGLNPGYGPRSSPYVDLLPGMRLRLEYNPSQSINAPQLNDLNGSRQITYTIGRDQEQRIIFDAFLGAISTPEIPFTPAMNIASGLMDLHAAGNARRHYRLFYPTQVPAPNSEAAASPGRCVTLVGADNLIDLQAATASYTTSGKIDVDSTVGRPVIAFMLLNRAAAIPEIGVTIRYTTGGYINKAITYVPLGTTLRQLTDNLVPGWNPKVFFTRGARPVKVKRLFPRTRGLPGYQEIRFTMAPDIYLDHSILNLPLTRNDLVEVNLPPANIR